MPSLNNPGALVELIDLFADRGLGITITPVAKGQPMGGVGSSDYYEFDGWEIGYIAGFSGGEIAVGRTLDEAIEAALEIERDA